MVTTPIRLQSVLVIGGSRRHPTSEELEMWIGSLTGLAQDTTSSPSNINKEV